MLLLDLEYIVYSIKPFGADSLVKLIFVAVIVVVVVVSGGGGGG